MSSSKDNNNNWFKDGLSRVFIEPTSIPPFLQYFMTLFEFFTFTIFISSNSLIGKSLIFADVIQRNMIIFLSLMFVLRYLTRLEIIKSIYVMLIVWNVQCSFGFMAIIVYALIFAHLCIDVVSKMEFSFETKNIHSSTYPWLLAIHYKFMCTLTITRFVSLPKNFIFPLCEIGAALIMLIFQERAIYKYEDFKNIHLRFYFLTAFYAFAEIYEIFIAHQPLWKSVFAIIGSQLLYEFIHWKFYAQFTLEEYVSKKLQIQAGFYLFSFLYSKKQVNKIISKSLKTLANEDTNCLIEQKTFKQALGSNNTKRVFNEGAAQQNKTSESKQAALRLISIIKDRSSIYAKLLIAQLSLFQIDQHIKCKHILTQLYNKTKWYNFLQRILINKIEKKVLAHLKIEHDKRTTPMFYEFIQNDHFRNLLLKSAINFIELWEYTKVKQGIYKRINQLAQRVIHGKHKIHKWYKQLKTKCIKINLLYGSYLFLVQRNSVKANQIMQKLYFYQQKQENLESDDKVYVKISIQFTEPFRIQSVGSNINKYLGYDKRIVIGSSINNLLPQFYKDQHDRIMADLLLNQPQKLYLFTKTTIIKHSKGNYVVGLFCTRVTYDMEGQLYIHGFIKFETDERHNWHNYLFVRNSTRQIVECSSLVNDKISSIKGKRFSADQFFDNVGQNDFWTKIQTFTSDLNKYYYQPTISFDANEDKVTMFVQFDPYAESVVIHNVRNEEKQETKKRKILIPQMIVYPKYKVFDNIKQFLRLKISTKQALEELKYKIIVFVFIVGVMVMGIYIIQGVNVINVNSQYNTKIETMVITNNILRHYMSLSKIGVDLSYLVVNQSYGYNYPSYNISLRDNILTVQETNLYFKPYSISTWVYESLSPVQQYRSCYQFVTEVLAAASFVDQVPSNKQVRDNMIQSYNKLFTQTFVWSYPEYTTRIQQKLASNSANRDIYQIIKIVILTLISTVLYIFIIKIEKSIRITEHQTLQFISSLTFQQQIITKTKEFIYLITEEKIENLITTNKSPFGGMANFNPQNTKMSQMSARQSTGRDLMGNMSGRDTIRTTQNPQQQTSDQLLAQNSPIKLKPANKIFIILPLIMLLIIIALQIFNYVINVKLKQIDEAQSSQNIVSWMNKPLFFTRVVNAFLTEDRGPQFTDHDSTFYKTYNAFQNSYNSAASFDQASYPQFSDFAEKLRKIRFEYLCTYAACPSFDKDYVNILYTTTMQKLVQYMLANQYFLNDPNNKMNTILASQQLFRTIMTDLIQTYIKDYNQYTNNYKNNQMLFIIVIFVILSLLAIMLILQTYFKVYKSLVKHLKICNIVKQSSYLISKEDLISFQQEEIQRQKTQKKKQGKKKTKSNESKDLQNQNSQIFDNIQKVDSQRNSPRQKKQAGPSKFKKQRGQDGKDRKTSIFKQLESKNK